MPQDQQQLTTMLLQQLSNLSVAYIAWSLVFSTIGLAYFAYAKKRSEWMLLLCGVVLMVYPYFITNTAVLVTLGAVLSAFPYLCKKLSK